MIFYSTPSVDIFFRDSISTEWSNITLSINIAFSSVFLNLTSNLFHELVEFTKLNNGNKNFFTYS